MRFKALGLRRSALLLVFGLAGATSGCDSLLNVTNPATFGDEDLNDPLLSPQVVNGVVARFQFMIDDLALNSAIITDEAVTGNNFETVQRVDLRQVDKNNSGDVYTPLQLTRALADSGEARLKRVHGDSAARHIDIARVQAYGAMTYTLMGEFLCAAPVEPTSGAVSPDSMFRIAIARSSAAIATVAAHRSSWGATTRADSALRMARADSLVNLARVAGARAHLNLGEKTQAAALARQVPAAFELRSFYNDVNSTNIFQSSTSGTNRNLGVDVAFRGLNDPRVRHSARDSTGHDQRTRLFTPRVSPSFSGYNATTPASFTRSTSIRVASGLEAQYIVAESEGPTAANVAFLNSRREIGGQAALTSPTQAEFLTALIDQRRRDFFLDGHRLGDLRRYKRLYGLNFFPTGQHPTANRGAYGTSECFVPTTAEEVGNPGYRP
jgi:hypothetical protein